MNYLELNDEELLLLTRLGDYTAHGQLDDRYYQSRRLHAARARLGLGPAYEAFENHGFFLKSLENAAESFRFSLSRFRKYMETILGNDIAKVAKEEKKKGAASLSEPISPLLEDEVTFEDVVSCSKFEDPKIYLNYFEEAVLLSKLPKRLKKRTIEVVSLRLEGHSYSSIAANLKVAPSTAKRHFQAFLAFVIDTLDYGHIPGTFLECDG